MLFVKKGFKFISVSIFVTSLVLTGCSFLPWNKDKKDDEDLFFEEDFGSEFESKSKDAPPADKGKEDDFFKDDKELAQSELGAKSKSVPVSPDEEDFFFKDEPMDGTAPKPISKPKSQQAKKIEQKNAVVSGGSGDDFASMDQKIDKKESKVDVAALHVQQGELMFRVQELQKIVKNLEQRLTTTQDQVDTSLSTGPGAFKANSEIQSLRSEIIQLKNEIATLKNISVKKSSGASKQSKSNQKTKPARPYPKLSKTPEEYNRALAAYKAGKYDESILLFQEMSLNNPPQNLKDNIVFWMGSNYFKLDMYDDAIAQFQAVLTQYPNGNKVHDARYMLGVCYQKKGDTGKALDALKIALKSNPPSEVRQKIEKQLKEIK